MFTTTPVVLTLVGSMATLLSTLISLLASNPALQIGIVAGILILIGVIVVFWMYMGITTLVLQKKNREQKRKIFGGRKWSTYEWNKRKRRKNQKPRKKRKKKVTKKILRRMKFKLYMFTTPAVLTLVGSMATILSTVLPLFASNPTLQIVTLSVILILIGGIVVFWIYLGITTLRLRNSKKDKNEDVYLKKNKVSEKYKKKRKSKEKKI